MTNGTEKSERRISLILLVLTALNCTFQIAWFWRFRGHNITMDGVNYIGLARHLLDGNFTASLHGYWSPLLSWMIAAGSLFTQNFTLLGRSITIASFLLCLPLLYALTFQLWRSHLASALAVFWFSIARGVVAGAVTTIQADFLLAACSLTYFLRLLACLRQGTRLNWFLLGVVHAAAFLAKAFAMPWLSITTALAVLASNRKSLRSATAALLLAFLAPAIMWLTWGEALKTKYGVFTTGYQLRANLAIDLKRKLNHHERGDPYALVDTSYDKYMVAETPWPVLQQFRMMNPALAPVILENELHNVPAALKEVVILLTPGGVLALAVGLTLLTRRRASYSPEVTFAWISVISLATLVGAYGMLVFDTRYVLPITPILMAIASYFLVAGEGSPPDRLRVSSILRKTALGLLLMSMVFFAVYWASPFRTVDRDFQMSCYHAAALLKSSQPSGENLVSIGDGPYPEHGIGFEAGVYVAYLTGRPLSAMNSALPDGDAATQLAEAVLGKKADAVLVWGKPGNRSYQTIVDRLRSSPGASLDQAIQDPKMGEVGRVVFLVRR
jgi:4-amino-4-deoxy-L-arabinose transferase-like glycosyltransferase